MWKFGYQISLLDREMSKKPFYDSSLMSTHLYEIRGSYQKWINWGIYLLKNNRWFTWKIIGGSDLRMVKWKIKISSKYSRDPTEWWNKKLLSRHIFSYVIGFSTAVVTVILTTFFHRFRLNRPHWIRISWSQVVPKIACKSFLTLAKGVMDAVKW